MCIRDSPFITHHNTLDIDMYMRIATELPLKLSLIHIYGLSLLTILPFQSMIAHILPVFIGAGLFIGVVGSVLAIRKFLKV